MTFDDKSDEWRSTAEDNVDEWGVQPPADIVLALAEELSEVAEEIVENSEVPPERYGPDERQLMYFMTEVIVLGNQIREELEGRYEDDEGRPIPMNERPELLGEIENSEPVMEEVDDLAPLVYQLVESIEENSKW